MDCLRPGRRRRLGRQPERLRPGAALAKPGGPGAVPPGPVPPGFVPRAQKGDSRLMIMFFPAATALRNTSRLGAKVVTMPLTSLSRLPARKVSTGGSFQPDPSFC